MEINAYTQLKADRDAARAEVNNTRQALRGLKTAIPFLPEAAKVQVTAIREGLKDGYGAAKVRRDELTLKVTEARTEYRIQATEEEAPEDDEDDEIEDDYDYDGDAW